MQTIITFTNDTTTLLTKHGTRHLPPAKESQHVPIRRSYRAGVIAAGKKLAELGSEVRVVAPKPQEPQQGWGCSSVGRVFPLKA